ncbi:probable prolyl 4-hydroxylase 9 [Mercurialis annua]|uniref:probable prolyl 4-hydroxylase 9 n=1 Tax=Mercurialis annua TaxID=3986 RepID=UPI00215E45C3|nr:probable prolyl 4-hydroxylase 9 [Mercurialis annua]XP_050209387.1 probable prolyl 4-hydroxylase 9 [Mercurialis annua]
MKIKTKRSKKKLGLPAALLLCCMFFLAGFYASTFLSQDVPVIKPRLRMLDVVNEEDESKHQDMPHGVTGEAYVESIPFQVLSWKPRAVYFPNFATPEQCETIIKAAKVHLKPSALALRKGETDENTKGTRTSSGTFISSSEEETGTLAFIEQKISRATMIPASHGEAFNILRYEIGQKYDSHYDSFNPTEYGPQMSQRVASFLLYLSDVEKGGETMFPFENGAQISSFDYRNCVGLKVKPRQGDGILFYSLLPNGTIDQTSLHGSCPVIEGQKWVATKWIRDQVQMD